MMSFFEDTPLPPPAGFLAVGPSHITSCPTWHREWHSSSVQCSQTAVGKCPAIESPRETTQPLFVFPYCLGQLPHVSVHLFIVFWNGPTESPDLAFDLCSTGFLNIQVCFVSFFYAEALNLP